MSSAEALAERTRKWLESHPDVKAKIQNATPAWLKPDADLRATFLPKAASVASSVKSGLNKMSGAADSKAKFIPLLDKVLQMQQMSEALKAYGLGKKRARKSKAKRGGGITAEDMKVPFGKYSAVGGLLSTAAPLLRGVLPAAAQASGEVRRQGGLLDQGLQVASEIDDVARSSGAPPTITQATGAVKSGITTLDEFSDLLRDVYGLGKKRRKGTGRPLSEAMKKRNAMVKMVMQKQGVKLGEASRIVKKMMTQRGGGMSASRMNGTYKNVESSESKRAPTAMERDPGEMDAMDDWERS